jgi:hypothetical protein
MILSFGPNHRKVVLMASILVCAAAWMAKAARTAMVQAIARMVAILLAG